MVVFHVIHLGILLQKLLDSCRDLPAKNSLFYIQKEVGVDIRSEVKVILSEDIYKLQFTFLSLKRVCKYGNIEMV